MTKLSAEDIIERAKLKHSGKYDYNHFTYVNRKTKVIITCRKHGDFEQLVRKHLEGQGCPKCKNENRTLTQYEFLKRAKEVHGNKYDYSQTVYVKTDTKIRIICSAHGVFDQEPENHLQGQGCHKCYGRGIYRAKPTTEDIISRAEKIHDNKYDYSQTIYTDPDTKVTIICPIHGSFTQKPYNHLSGQGCHKCTNKISKGERDWLDLCGVPDDDAHRYVYLLINDKKYYVDGIISDTKTIYEFYGDYWHGNPEVYDQDKVNISNKRIFGELYASTLEKEKALIEAGYNIVSIWETEWNTLKKKRS